MPFANHERTLLDLRAAQAGDRDAVEQLFARYRDRLLEVVCLLMAKRRTELGQDEEDIVQESLLDAFTNLAAFEPRSEGGFLQWLSRIAENNLRDAARRRGPRKRGEGRERRQVDLSGNAQPSSLFLGREPSPSRVAGARELAERVESAVLELSEGDRRTFVLRNLCGASFDELAAELGLGSAASARRRYSRILAQLGARLPGVLRP